MKPRKVVIDIAAVPPPDISLRDLLAEGTAAEIRERWGSIGAALRAGASIFPDERELLGAALEAIGAGQSPKVVLGLTTNRRLGLYEKRFRAALVQSLRAEGVSKEDAAATVERLRFDAAGKGFLADIDRETAINRVKKRVQRSPRKGDKLPA